MNALHAIPKNQPAPTPAEEEAWADLLDELGVDPSGDPQRVFEQLQQTMRTMLEDNRALLKRVSLQQNDLNRLMHMIEDQQRFLHSLKHSLSWRVGERVVALARKLLGKPARPSVFVEVESLKAVYTHWKKARD